MPTSQILDSLEPKFRAKIVKLINDCAGAGVEIRPYCGARTPLEQAKLWRQSRTRGEIESEIRTLRAAGAPYLSNCIEAVGPQFGRYATQAVPGQSWHNFRLAVDCAVVEAGKFVWDSTHGGYEIYAHMANKAGLDAGFYWPAKIRDAVHVQLITGSPLLHFGGWPALDAELKKIYGDSFANQTVT